MYDFVLHGGFEGDILIDGGVNRLLFPEEIYQKLQESPVFCKSDFVRKRSSSNVETFMNGVTNIHRDFNRPHSVEMFNCWIPMHSMDENEVLRIYPKYFQQRDVLGIDNTQKNIESLGEYEKVALKTGDFLMFHSEQLHVSPKRDKNTTFRHSFDFRIMSRCQDDGGHYRENFEHINNFITPTKLNISTTKIDENQLLSLNDVCLSAPIALQKYKHNLISKEKLFMLYKKLPFSEDRFINLALETLEDKTFVLEIIAYVSKKTDKYFWIYKLYQLATYIQEEELSKELFQKAVKFSKENSLNFSHNFVNYTNKHREIDDEKILKKETQEYQDLLIIPKDYIGYVEDTVKSSECLVFAPSELDKFLTYSNIKAICYSNDINQEILYNFLKINNNYRRNIHIIPSRNDDENFTILKVLQNMDIKAVIVNGKQVLMQKDNLISFMASIKNSVKLGKNIKIHQLVTIDDYTTIMNNVKIDKASSISTHVHIYNDCSIQKFCAIGANCVIAAPPHHINSFTISNKVNYKNETKFKNSTRIGNDVWIGANTVILANVTIGDGVIIGANSLVNKDIPPYSIAFGSPAKVYKKRFPENIIQELENIQWWNIDGIEEKVMDFDIKSSLKEMKKILLKGQ